MIRRAILTAFVAMMGVFLAVPAAATHGNCGRLEHDHVGQFNFVLQGRLILVVDDDSIIDPTYLEGDDEIIDPTYFPEGPIGHSLVAVIDGTFISEVDGKAKEEAIEGELEADVVAVDEKTAAAAGVLIDDDLLRELDSEGSAEIEWTITCAAESQEPGFGSDDFLREFDDDAPAEPTVVRCSVEVEGEPGFGSDDFLAEFDSEGDLIELVAEDLYLTADRTR